jgi:hypothetical protein
MPSRHDLTTSTYRPTKEELANAKTHIPAGRTVDGFLRACLKTLNDQPETMLELLGDRWPEEKPRGRPRKQPTE